MGAVGAVVVGWGVAQWPYILPETLKVEDAAAPSGTLGAILFVFVVAAIVWLVLTLSRSARTGGGARSWDRDFFERP